jgi:hypothetical protein
MCGTARRGADALPTAQGTGGDYGPPAESGIQDGFFCLSNFGLAFCRRRYVAARSVEPYAHFAVTLTGDEWNRNTPAVHPKGRSAKLPGGLWVLGPSISVMNSRRLLDPMNRTSSRPHEPDVFSTP